MNKGRLFCTFPVFSTNIWLVKVSQTIVDKGDAYHTLSALYLKSYGIATYGVRLFFWLAVFGINSQIAKAEAVNLQFIAEIESSGNTGAIGDGGRALGLFQLHEAVIVDYNRRNHTSYSHKDALNPAIATKIADWYLNTEIPRLLKHFKLADTIHNRIHAYNGGIGNVVKGRLSPITKRYIQKYERMSHAL